MDHDLLQLLGRVDMPTVCNAIETVQGRRGFDGYTRGTMLCSAPGEPALVGYAATAQIAARAPSTEDPRVIRTRRMGYYRMMAVAPKTSVAVIEDLGPAIARMQQTEQLVLGPARAPEFDFAAFQKAWAAFEAARI